MSQLSELVSDVVATPLGDVIAAVGRGVADAQTALDEGSLAQTLALYSEGGDAALSLLRDIGYQPTFYTLPETTAEVRVVLKLGGAVEQFAQSPAESNPISAVAVPTQPVSTTNVEQTLATTPRAAILAARKEQLEAPAANSYKSTTTPDNATTSSSANVLQQALAASRARQAKLYATPVDASYSNRFNFNAEVSAILNFKIVPVPPPAGMELIRVLPNLIQTNLADAVDRIDKLNLTAEVSIEHQNGVVSPLTDSDVLTQFNVISQSPNNTPIVKVGDVIYLRAKHYSA